MRKEEHDTIRNMPHHKTNGTKGERESTIRDTHRLKTNGTKDEKEGTIRNTHHHKTNGTKDEKEGTIRDTHRFKTNGTKDEKEGTIRNEVLQIPPRQRNRLLVGGGRHFYTRLPTSLRASVPSSLCGGSVRVRQAQEVNGDGTEDLVEWTAPDLTDHLENLDLEAEPDQSLASKEQKKVRRAMRNLVETYGKERETRPTVIFHVRADHREPAKAEERDPRQVEVVEFLSDRRWDFSSGHRRRALEQLVKKFNPDLLILDTGPCGRDCAEKAGWKEQVRGGVVSRFCRRLCTEQMEKGRAVVWRTRGLGDQDQKILQKAGGITVVDPIPPDVMVTNRAGTL